MDFTILPEWPDTVKQKLEELQADLQVCALLTC